MNAPAATHHRDVISQGAKALGLDLTASCAASLERHLALIEKWNAVHNLTAVRDTALMATQHVLDSLSIARFLPCGSSVLDVGSGAGFPGLSLAIARPDLAVVVLDSNQKKIAFLQHCISALKVSNASSVCARVEKWSTPAPFQIIVSRALSELKNFVSLCRHLLATNGRLLAMKGTYPKEEIQHLPSWAAVESVQPLEVPGLNAERHLVIVSLR